jgi:hypothetical protein
MLRRVVAALLLILTVSPFTAPFATCDMTALLSDDIPLSPQQPAVSSTVEDGSHSVPLCAGSVRIRARIKFISQTATSSAEHRLVVRTVSLALQTSAAPLASERGPLTTLRI